MEFAKRFLADKGETIASLSLKVIQLAAGRAMGASLFQWTLLRGASYRVSSKRGITKSLVGIGIGYCSIHRVASGLTRLRGGESSLRRG
ncbi:hypothetical protein IEQ34_024590 [Dendrobium chrysotoxum]|uniref:Uncharacterized protein n=1 Tax=Dendrobium chrysotoxum TaxID=161865 RepID=A0AAV7FJC5_DENCH|nr:hypothetical protein IEQ34_024590 [Dendrobium chrysotoxum]